MSRVRKLTNIIPEIIKLLEESICSKFSNISLSNICLAISPQERKTI